MRLDQKPPSDATPGITKSHDRPVPSSALGPAWDFRRELNQIKEEVEAMALDVPRSLDVMAAFIERSLARRLKFTRGASISPEACEALPDPHTISQQGAGGGGRSPYLGAEDAAAYLGITLKSLYGVVERGHLTPLRGPRRRYRFTKAMLDDYLGRGRTR